MKGVISGSYRRFYTYICDEVIPAFEAQGIKVLSPPRSRIVNPGAEFVLFEADGTADVSVVERRHLAKIAEADFLYCYNPDGYLGIDTAIELGFASAHGVPIIALAYTGHPGRDCFIKYVCKPREVGFYLQEELVKNTQAEEASIV
jgi:hypothetical protein